MNQPFDLSDRVVIVTGTTGALAGSAAHYLASQGARVVYLGRSEKKLERPWRSAGNRHRMRSALG